MKRKAARRVTNGAVYAKKYLEKVHGDLIGPVKTNSYQKCKYIVVFRDEYTGRCWVRPIREAKSTVVRDVFISCFPSQTEMPERVRVDGGPEFRGKFLRFCKRKGIKVSRGVANSPQTRSRAERFNMILNDGIRCSLAQAGLPPGFWDLAAIHWATNYNYAVFQQNTKQTPDMLYPHKIDLVRRGVHVPFGCACDVYVDKKFCR